MTAGAHYASGDALYKVVGILKPTGTVLEAAKLFRIVGAGADVLRARLLSAYCWWRRCRWAARCSAGCWVMSASPS
jgi:hypothetical protein